MKESSPCHDCNSEVKLDNLYPALVQCFSIILCGYGSGRLNLITQQECKGLNTFVSNFLLPSMIFLSLAQLNLSSVNWTFLASILLSKSIVFFAVIIVTFIVNRPIHYGKPGIYAVFCTQSNDFAIGFPILSALYGNTHPEYPAYLYLLAPISLAILNPIAFVLMEFGKQQQLELSDNGKKANGDDDDDKIAESELRSLEDAGNDAHGISSLFSSDDQNLTDLTKSNDKLQSRLKFCGRIFKSILSNPIVFMTAFGLMGNIFFQYLGFVAGILKDFSSAFSATALFVLGLRMVGTVQKLKGGALVVPGILIIIKLLVLPLVTREVVSILQPGRNQSETLDLSTFGFLYGTFPAAPAVFVFSVQYNLEVDLISSSMVACTFLSAPLMFISAKMTTLGNLYPQDYFRELQTYGRDLAIIGIPLGIWMITLFILNKFFCKFPHKVTGFLVLSQMILCVGALLQPVLVDRTKAWSLYLQFSVLAFGVYSSRIWSCFLAVTLVLLQSRSLCFVIKLLPIFVIVAWGVPVILVAAVCLASSPDNSMAPSGNPNFLYGSFQAATTLFLLAVCFVITSCCLVLQQRYRKRHQKYLLFIKEVNSKDLRESESSSIERVASEEGHAETSSSEARPARLPTTKKVVDIEEIISESGVQHFQGASTSNCENQNNSMCSMKFHCTETQRTTCESKVREYNDQVTDEEMDSEIEQGDYFLRHVVLLILIVTSMFVGMMLSAWTLVAEDIFSGIYVELAFLDVTLNVGQICFTFAIFGLDAKTILDPVAKWWRKIYYGADTIVLTAVEELSFETTHVCQQFIAHHLDDCEKDIARDRRLRLTLYRDCFNGRALVLWLQEKRLAKDSAEAIQYACHLLEGRVIRHVEERHHFTDSSLLYTFKW